MVSIQGLLFPWIIYSKKDRDMATEDNRGDLLQIYYTSGIIHSKFDGTMEE